MGRYFAKRLSEPSTWAGFGLLAAAFGVPPEILPVIAKVGAAFAAVLSVALPENK